MPYIIWAIAQNPQAVPTPAQPLENFSDAETRAGEIIETHPCAATFAMIIDTEIAGTNGDAGVIAEYRRNAQGKSERTFIRDGYGPAIPKP